VFHAIDSDTNQPVNIMVEIEFLINNIKVVEKLQTPILMLECKKILSVKVIEDDFYNFEI